MQLATLLASVATWISSISSEIYGLFNQMNTIQWGIVSTCAVIFGFLCLKGSGANR